MWDTLLAPEILYGLGIPVLLWVGKQIRDVLEEIKVNSEASKETLTHLDKLNTRVTVVEVDMVDLKLEAAWLRGRIGEPLEPKVPE